MLGYLLFFRPVVVEGLVVKNITECHFDGACVLVVNDGQRTYFVTYGGGLGWCMKEPIGYVDEDIKVGDKVKVYAKRESLFGRNNLTLCGSKDFYIKKLTPHQSSESDSTTNWKIYKNEKFGFEFKYPPEFYASSSGPNYVQQQIERGEIITGTQPPIYETITFFDQKNKEQFNVIILPETKQEILHLSPQEFKKSYLYLGSACDFRWLPGSSSITSGPTILNKNGISVLSVKISWNYPENGNIGCFYFKNSQGNLVVFNVSGFKNESDFSRIFYLVSDKILSTLKIY